MIPTVEVIVKYVSCLRKLTSFSQKEVCSDSGFPKAQYIHKIYDKFELFIALFKNLVTLINVSLTEFFNSDKPGIRGCLTLDSKNKNNEYEWLLKNNKPCSK